MAIVKFLLAGIILLTILGMLAIRYWPLDAERWHVDPSKIDQISPRTAAQVKIPITADTQIDQNLLSMFPRSLTLLAGDPDAGFATYVTRSRLMGYPDVVSIKIVDQVLFVYSRSVIGDYDHGVNKARLMRFEANYLASLP